MSSGFANTVYRRPIQAGTQSPRALSPRQIACLELAHLSNADIGLALGIAEGTVEAHFKSIYLKLDAESRVHAVMIWFEMRQRQAA
jgi:DNA-binding NarL/FixJ family response regulator